MAKINPTEENFEKMDKLLTKFFEERDAKNQAENVIQSIIDFEVTKGILDNLPSKEERDKFMTKFTENPNDGEEVLKYLEEKGITKQVEAIYLKTSQKLVTDLRHDIEITTETLSEGKVPVK